MRQNRQIALRIKKRLDEPSPLIQVIIGPRQVGKTTALKFALNGRGIYETADYPTPLSHSVIEKWWRRAEQDPSRILAIDEVQKIPGWSEVVKRLWETLPRIKLVVTGSSALLMEKGLKETLAGRFELIRAEHWNFDEAKNIFNYSLKKYIEFGCYPGAVEFMNDPDRWGNYIRDSIVEPAIGRDLLQLHPVDQPALLRQVFGSAISLPAQIVSLQKLQGQLQGRGTLPTLQSYLQLLKDAFLVTGVEKFSESGFRARKSVPKLITHDNALVRAFERPIGSKISPERLGHYFENQVGARLIEAGWDTYYWKDRLKEVDFVTVGPEGQKLAIEVKTSKIAESDLTGLKDFCRRHPKFEPCLVSLLDQSIPGVRRIEPEWILSLHRQ